MAASKTRFFWIDLEMTGLDPQKDRILEAAVIVTDKYLVSQYEYETTVYQPGIVIEKMNDWCQKHHAESGLLRRIRENERFSEEQLDRRLCDIVQSQIKRKSDQVVICGNSIAQDRRFIDRYLPRFAEKLDYRMLDVSSFKIVFRDMLGREFLKQNNHRALDDIRESIDELKYYMKAIDPNGLTPIGGED